VRIREHNYYVYMMTNKRNGTLYTGMTNDLVRRVYEHKHGMLDGFTKQYGLKTLVWFEHHTDVNEAIKREKNIQAWKRQWKLELIEKANPDWNDLYEEITGCQPALA
jgi:putative endonuclease